MDTNGYSVQECTESGSEDERYMSASELQADRGNFQPAFCSFIPRTEEENNGITLL